MPVSKRMQKKLDRIDYLIDKGYELEKFNLRDYFLLKPFNLSTNLELPFPVIKDNKGNEINALFKANAGFSWIAFFFPAVFFFKIREYSFFYFFCFFYIVCGLFELSYGETYLNNFGNLIIGLISGFNFPYIRHINISRNIKERGLFQSIVLGTLLSLIAIIPYSLIISSLIS